MKKICKSFVIVITILFLICPCCFAETDFKKQIKSEDGSTFEKIIAGMIGGIAQTVFDFATSDTANVGFKDYDELIFNQANTDDTLSPFSQEIWDKIMTWYKIIGVVSEILILIATILLAYKIITCNSNTAKKNEAKDNIMRLITGALIIAFFPMFIRFLLFINNSLVKLLVKSANSGIDGLLGESMITSIKTGNAITTAIVISMFIYLFLKLNIKFIIRQFTLIVFSIFTPISVSLWIINKNSTAISIWIGQILINVFMQFIYCFLFLIYLTFLPSGAGWAVSLIWAMMILPLAETLQNSLQNLTSRIAGIDNEQMSGRALGLGAAVGYSFGAIKEQFKSPNDNNSLTQGTNNSFINRVKSFINPQSNTTYENNYKDTDGPIRDIVYESKGIKKLRNDSPNKDSSSKISKVVSTGGKLVGGYLSLGKNMVEGDFSSEKANKTKYKKNVNTLQNTSYINILKDNEQQKNEGDKNEPKK